MKGIKYLVIAAVVIAVGCLSWFLLEKKPSDAIPKRATFVMNRVQERNIPDGTGDRNETGKPI